MSTVKDRRGAQAKKRRRTIRGRGSSRALNNPNRPSLASDASADALVDGEPPLPAVADVIYEQDPSMGGAKSDTQKA